MAPSTHTAVVVAEKKTVEVKKVAIPTPGEGEVLVKVVAAALNPTDWKHVKSDVLTKPGAVSGCDFAGEVEKLGPGAEGVKVGDRVAGFVHGGTTSNGAYAEYVAAKADILIHLPESWTFEQGAQLPIAIYTTFQALYQSHSLPTPLAPTSDGTPLLVYGASSAVGLYILQVAKAAGLKTYALCSSKNFDLVRSFGANEAYDYHDPEASTKIKAASGGRIRSAVDAISSADSLKIIVSALSSEGGKIAVIPFKEIDQAVLGDKYVAVQSLGYDLIHDRKDAPSRLGDAAGYAKLATQLLVSGKVKPTPVRVWENGLEGVSDAMDYMEAGKVSGEKIIFRIADTPGLS